MASPEQQLKRIHEKLQELLKKHVALEKENQQLRKENLLLKEKSVSQQTKVEELKQQGQILKMNSGEMNTADKKEFEKKINGYVKEIERCIAMLGE
jgi:hypothetical protein